MAYAYDAAGNLTRSIDRNYLMTTYGYDRLDRPTVEKWYLSPEQIKASRIADNQTASLAEWDYDLLPIELADLQACNFDLNLLGFDADELAKLLGPDLKEGLCDPDAATTKPGDLWILGDHRLLCSDPRLGSGRFGCRS